MPLSTGEKLGPYEIVCLLGKGGMGEVYKARDPRLNRDVAIKRSASEFTERFRREAHAIASLNHPNICQVFDVGPDYLVMELIDGTVLRGPRPLAEALEYARQLLDALDAAHRKKLVHRDLKPANVMVTAYGIKLLDFGLAKQTALSADSDETLTQSLTVPGQMAGTLPYMSPEQLHGKEADARSDIFAFGCLLYEIISGKRPFGGATAAATIAAVLDSNPPALDLPPSIDRVLRRCLAKDPDDRFQSVRDLSFALGAPATQSTSIQNRQPVSWHWPAVTLLCFAAAVAGWWPSRQSTSPAPGVKFDVLPPEGQQFSSIADGGGATISPDGHTLAFVASAGQSSAMLYVRRIDSLQPRLVPGTEGAARPFWSPDSQSIAFVAQGKLKHAEVDSGAIVTLCEADGARGGAWSRDGTILFGSVNGRGIRSVPASGGAAREITRVDTSAGEFDHYYPQFLPDGRTFLYLVRSRQPARAGTYVGSLNGAPPQLLLAGEYRAVYDAASRNLLHMPESGKLMASRIEGNPPRLIGNPVLLAEQVGTGFGNGFTNVSVSDGGVLLYGRSPGMDRMRFAWRDRAGKLLATVGEPVDNTGMFRLSPDGASVAYSSDFAASDIWLLDLSRGTNARVTFSGAQKTCWSPDGKYVYYRTKQGIYRTAVNGAQQEEPVVAGSKDDFPQSVSPDGKYLLFGAQDINLVELRPGARPVPYLATAHQEWAARHSPNGQWVAYFSDDTGRAEVYVTEFPVPRSKRVISAAGGKFPFWRADGKELYWVDPDNRLVAASVDSAGQEFRTGRAEILFRLPITEGFTDYQPSTDGRRFLVREPQSGQRPDRPLAVHWDWAKGLKH